VAAWPYTGLDIDQLRSDGWRPTPIRDLILKVHQRCNLACDYCYVYTQVDQSWRDRPAVMPDDVWRAAIAALSRHAEKHRLKEVRVILHGGEPLLFGGTRLDQLATEARAAMPPGCEVEFSVQTNGVRLNAAMMALLREHRVSIGVSVDGTAEDHDRHRRTRGGRGSFAAVSAAIELLREPENRACYAGLLCTVSPDTDPIATYEQLRAFEPRAIDLLLPHANWKNPPWRPEGASATAYADWLIPIFEHWYTGGHHTRIRLFEDIISLLLGGGSRSEQVGISPSGIIVVESDGAIEQVDALKSAYEGACATGLDIRTHELDDALADPGIVARQIGTAALAPECEACPIHRICGAGHYAHRYTPDSGFRHRSVYCDDMTKLINHIYGRVAAEIAQHVAKGSS
jgi:uncharacterized protein